MILTKIRKIAGAILASAIILFFTIGLLEICMIVLEPYLFKGLYQYDADIGFRVRPYAGNSNRFGFNDRDYPLKKDPHTLRILFLGDSFGWVGGLEDNYTALLEKLFETHYEGHRVDIINAGYPMTHTAEQLQILKKFGLQYEPDCVVLGFFVGNDFVDANPNRKRIVVNDVYFDIDRRREIVFLGYPIVLKSRSFHFVRQKYLVAKELVKSRRDPNTKSDSSNHKEEQFTLSEDRFLELENQKLELFNLNRYQYGIYSDRIDYILQSISTMKKVLDARGIRMVVCLYPDEFQVDESLLNQIFERFRLSEKDYDIELLQKILIRHLAEENIPHIDLLQEFRTESKNRRLYLLRDTHWNGSGRELAAAIIYKRLIDLIENDFIPLSSLTPEQEDQEAAFTSSGEHSHGRE